MEHLAPGQLPFSSAGVGGARAVPAPAEAAGSDGSPWPTGGTHASGAVPPAPQAIVSIVLNTTANGSCAAVHTASIPQVPQHTGLVVTDTQWHGDMLTDGDGGSVTCTVKPVGTGFSVMGSVTLSQDTHPEWGTISLSVPEIADNQPDAVGTLTLSDYQTAGTYSGTCRFSTSGGKLQVAKGRIWASVQCDDVREGLATGLPVEECAIGKSYFIFQNCVQE